MVSVVEKYVDTRCELLTVLNHTRFIDKSVSLILQPTLLNSATDRNDDRCEFLTVLNNTHDS